MQEETNKIISLAEASNITGYTQDYLGFLYRTGKLEGQKIGRNWTTTRSALEQMRFDAELTSGPSQTQEHSSLGSTKIPVKVLPSIVIPSEVDPSRLGTRSEALDPVEHSLILEQILQYFHLLATMVLPDHHSNRQVV
jgi:hypothetical protein